MVVGASCWWAAALAAGVGLAQPPAAALLVAAPVAVSAVASVALTGVFAVLAVGAAVGLGWVHHWSSALAHGLVIGGVAAGSAAAVGAAGVRTRAEAARADAERGRERERRRRRAVEASDRLHRLSASLASCGTVAEVAEATFASLRAEVGADAALLGVTAGEAEGGPVLRFLRAVGYRTDAGQRWPREPVAPDMPGFAVVRTGEPVFAGSADALARSWPDVAADVLDGRLQAVCVLPLVVSARPVGFLSASWSVRRRFADEERGFLQAAAGQCAQAIERARLAEEERRARRRLSFVGDVSRLVASSLEPSAAMARLVDLVVGAMADACAVLVPDGPGLRCEALAGRTPGSADLLRDVVARDTGPGGDGPASRALAEGRRAVSEIRPGGAPGAADDPQSGRGAGAAPLDVVSLPLIAGAERIGVMVFLCGIDTGALEGDDLSLATEIAARASTALYNASRFQHERGLATLLQRAVLPQELPDVPGVVLDAVYRAGTAGTEVGGDWFDAVALDDGRVLVSVGDVMGKGPAAAALMSQVRSAARAYGVADPRPGRVLRQLDRLLATFGDTRLVSAVVAVVEPGSGRVCLASAGHPPALVVGPGRLQVVDGGRQRMLGTALPDAGPAAWVPGQAATSASAPAATGGGLAAAETTVLLGRDDVLVLYSDGLVERRGELITDGIDRLLVAAAGCTSLEAWPRRAATCLADALAARDTADDVVVLTVGAPDALLAFDLPVGRAAAAGEAAARAPSAGEPSAPAGTPGASAPASAGAVAPVVAASAGAVAPVVAASGAPAAGAGSRRAAGAGGRPVASGVRLPAVAASGPAARRWLVSLLEGHPSVAPDARAAAEILVGELVANAVIHAGTELAVGARVDAGTVHVEVADGSPLLPVVQELGTDASTGRGLVLVRRLADAWGVEVAGGGKVVWFEVGGSPASARRGAAAPWPPAVAGGGGRPAAPVALLGAPVATAVRSSSHYAAVWRELQVLVGGLALPGRPPAGAAGGPASPPGAGEPGHRGHAVDARLAGPVDRLARLGPAVTAALAPAVARWQRARAAGHREVDVRVAVPVDTGPMALELAALLDDIDRWCGDGLLLAMPAAADVVAFRRWALGEVAAQCAGGRPTPWAGG